MDDEPLAGRSGVPLLQADLVKALPGPVEAYQTAAEPLELTGSTTAGSILEEPSEQLYVSGAPMLRTSFSQAEAGTSNESDSLNAIEPPLSHNSAASASEIADDASSSQRSQGGLSGVSFKRSATLADLQSSWILFIFRGIHAWSFLVGTLVIAGFGLDLFLKMFLAFRWYLLEHHRVISVQDWVSVLSLVTSGFLMILVLSGLAQRGVWLLLDSLTLDAFKDYRRTVCFEGVGPGTFHHHRRKVYVHSQDELEHVRSKLTIDGGVILNMEVGETFIPSGARLLRCSKSTLQCADDLLQLELPERLDFMVDGRAAALVGVGGCGRCCAVVDIIWQLFLYYTLDLLPWVLATRGVGWRGIGSYHFFELVGTALVEVAICHILLFFCISTLADYYLKVRALVSMCRTFHGHAKLEDLLRDCRGMERTRMDAEVEKAFGIAAKEVQDSLHTGEARRRSAFRLSGTGGAPSSSDGHEHVHFLALEESLNACVCIRNMLNRHGKVFVIGATSLVGILLLPEIVHGAFLLVTFIVALFLLSSVCLLFAVYRRTAGLESEDNLTTTPIWPLWFRMNCGIDYGSGIMLAVGQLVCGGLAAFVVHSWTMIIVVSIFMAWNVAVLLVCIFSVPNRWKVLLTHNIFFGALTVYSASQAYGPHYQGPAALGLLFFSQLGFWRLSRTQWHVLFKNFFVIVLVSIAGLTFLAVSSPSGLVFGNPPYDWCTDKSDPACKEFTVPLHGLPNFTYDFCGLWWEMGMNSSGHRGTVSDRCPDTALTLVDFGHLAAVPGYLSEAPHQTSLQSKDAVTPYMDKHLPGWKVRYAQIYDIHQGKHSTFMHLVRDGTSVIAVRGTSSVSEVLKDVTWWMPVSFLQLTAKFGPSLYSERLILETFVSRNQNYSRGFSFQDILEYTKKLKANLGPGERIFVTGHSLGGGLANAVGAVVDIPAITFSSPGLMATSAILEPKPELTKLMQRTVTVVPAGDVVPEVDGQVGTELPIQCMERNPMACHRLSLTLCELLAACGDGGGRGIPRGYVRSCHSCPPLARTMPTCESDPPPPPPLPPHPPRYDLPQQLRKLKQQQPGQLPDDSAQTQMFE